MRINKPDIFKHALWYKKMTGENYKDTKDTTDEDEASTIELWCNEVSLNF